MLLRKTPLSKRLTADEIESKLKDVVCVKRYIILLIHYANNMFCYFSYSY